MNEYALDNKIHDMADEWREENAYSFAERIAVAVTSPAHAGRTQMLTDLLEKLFHTLDFTSFETLAKAMGEYTLEETAAIELNNEREAQRDWWIERR